MQLTSTILLVVCCRGQAWQILCTSSLWTHMQCRAICASTGTQYCSCLAPQLLSASTKADAGVTCEHLLSLQLTAFMMARARRQTSHLHSALHLAAQEMPLRLLLLGMAGQVISDMTRSCSSSSNAVSSSWQCLWIQHT